MKLKCQNATAELDDQRLRLWIRTAMLLREKRKDKNVVDLRGRVDRGAEVCPNPPP
jgi:hypothetical protein